MGFRFQRRIKIAPGIRLNLSKSGVSTSIGGKGLTWNSRGTVTTSIPGTGLSYRHNLKAGKDSQEPEAPKVHKASVQDIARVNTFFYWTGGLFFLVGLGGSSLLFIGLGVACIVFAAVPTPKN